MPVTPEPTLTRNEWAAVSLALQDAQRCGCAAEALDARSGAIHRLGKLLFGRRRPTPLANPRLEAVRHFVCASRRRKLPATELASPLEEQGFSPAQIDALGLLSL